MTGGGIKLLVVTPRFLPLTGGVEQHVREVVRRLPPDLDATVLTTDTTGALPTEETLDAIRVLRVPAWPRGRDYRFAPAIGKVVADGGWDLLHVQSYHTGVAPAAMSAARRGRIPFVVTFHGGGHSSAVRTALRGAHWAALRPLLAGASKLIAVAEFEAASFAERLRIPRDRFVVIPNGSDLPAIADDERAQPGRRVIASVGRLERYKGHHRVIAAIPGVLEQVPDAELRVIGSGPYGGELQRLAERLGVADRIRIGPVPAADRSAMAAELAGASLVVLMSSFETHPLAVMEALALGTPVLAADTSGLRELAEWGLLRPVPLDTPAAALASAIVEQLRDPMRVQPVRLPTWDECAARIAEVYREVLGEGAVPGAAAVRHG